MRKWVLYICFVFILTACSMNPPDWIIGKWYDSKKEIEPEWVFTKDSVMTKGKKIESSFFIDWSDQTLERKYVLKASSILESEPHYEIFERISSDTILYYISNSLENKELGSNKKNLIRR